MNTRCLLCGEPLADMSAYFCSHNCELCWVQEFPAHPYEFARYMKYED